MWNNPLREPQPSLTKEESALECLRRPLLSLDTCAAIANKDNDDLIAAAERGAVLAFNIQRSQSGRRLVRVLASSLVDYVNGDAPDSPHWPSAIVRAKVADIFPALAVTIEAANLARFMSCDSGHVTGLIRDKAIQCERRSGINSSARVSRESAVNFLCGRVLRP
ncbi:MAG TPA: hypothetical protein VGF13_16185 [Verrucomicrobiae bacterium]|jgi:hypothetical protein